MQALNNTSTIKNEEKVAKVIEHVLTQVFGKEATCLIYNYLEQRYSLKPNEVAERIDIFAKGLEEFLSTGAYAVERRILEDIYSSYGLLRRLELERSQEETDFAAQIRSLMQKAC
ncbi:MAG: hypothetical protein QXJ02_00380 [Candidatus Bathyarchaeia archaeon]